MGIIQPEMGHTGITEFIADRPDGARLPRRHDPARLDRRRHLHGGEPAGDVGAAARALSRVPALDLRQESRLHDGRHGLRRWASTRCRPGRGWAWSLRTACSTTWCEGGHKTPSVRIRCRPRANGSGLSASPGPRPVEEGLLRAPLRAGTRRPRDPRPGAAACRAPSLRGLA